MKTKALVLFALAASLFLITCKKEDDGGSPSPSPLATPNPLRSYLAQNLADATQSFTVNAATGGSIQGNRGSRVDFVPGAFVTATGSPVTGTVQVKMVEVLTMADMLLMNKQTVGMDNGVAKMLKSGGELKISATQGGSEVFIVPNGATVDVPGSSYDPQMDVFYGTEDADGDLLWNLSTDTLTLQDSAVWDTTSGNWFYYEFDADSLNWLNCDYFPAGATAPLLVDAPDETNGANTMVWVAVPSLNGVLGAWYNDGLFNTNQVPIGYAAIVVALYQDEDDNYHSSFTNITVATGMTVPITFSPTTLAQFEADLDAL